MRRILGLLLLLITALALGATTVPADATAAAASPAQVVANPGSTDVRTARLLVQRRLEDRVLKLTNRKRRAHGCRALRASSALRKSSRRHTITMARHDEMSHRLPGEPDFTVRITRAGYRGWTMVAENVARGFGTAGSVVRAWMESPGHRRNILNCRLRHLGVGVVHSGGQLWWTQNFGRP